MTPAAVLKRVVAPLRGRRRVWIGLTLVLAAVASARIATAGDASSPIKHVVVILPEDHTFDNVVGQPCIQGHRAGCVAASSEKNDKGETIPLSKASDLVV